MSRVDNKNNLFTENADYRIKRTKSLLIFFSNDYNLRKVVEKYEHGKNKDVTYVLSH